MSSPTSFSPHRDLLSDPLLDVLFENSVQVCDDNDNHYVIIIMMIMMVIIMMIMVMFMVMNYNDISDDGYDDDDNDLCIIFTVTSCTCLPPNCA